MGECIICGTEVEGADICAFHEEDVLFTFTGNSPHDLIEGRYYEGTVDGFAEFGVFVDLGNGVTGLLHRNQLDRRLESLDWETGDTVCVQVTSISDDGNIDLDQSIRQSSREFRGALEHGAGERPAPAPTRETPSSQPTPLETMDFGRIPDIERTQVRALDHYLGAEVVLEGIAEEIRQTGGPTVFSLRDESGSVECAAFAGAGVRAYPQMDNGDVVRIRGGVESRFGEHQIEVEQLERLEDEEATAVRDRIADGTVLPASIDTAPLLHPDPGSDAIETDLREAAADIRRVVEEGRPIRIRHPVTVDGYVASAALERAIEHIHAQASTSVQRPKVNRRPMRSPEYNLDTAIRDVTQLERNADEDPFIILVSVGSTNPITEPFDLLDTYDIGYYIIDTANPHPKTLNRVNPLVNPWCGEGTFPIPSTTAVAVNVAALVNDDIRDELSHLPAIVHDGETSQTTANLLEESRYDEQDIETMRHAIALEAYYQPWEDKRALIRDLLFEREPGFVEPISEQFDAKLATAVETARHNADVHETNGTAFAFLDVERFGNRYEFPPDRLLLRGLLDSADIDASVAVGIGRDYLEIFATDRVSLREVTELIGSTVPDASVTLRGSDGTGQIHFLNGRRDEVADAAVEAIATALTA